MKQMNRMLLCMVLYSVQLAAARSGGLDACALTDVHYNVQPEASRVTMSFSGAVRYAAKRHANSITIGVSGARSALAQGKDAFRFNAGLVSALRVEQLCDDSITIHVDVRDKVLCSLALAAAGNGLVFNVRPRPGALIGLDTRETGSLDGPLHSSSNTGSAAVSAGRASPVVKNGAQDDAKARTQKSTLTLLVMLVLFSALSTCTLLYGLARRPWKRLRRVAPERPVVRPELPHEEERVARDDGGEPWETVLEEEQEETESRVSILARGLHRGTGELQLAMKMNGEARIPVLHNALQDIHASASSGAETISIAKKLGVGCGEVDLAIRLKEFKSTHAPLEEEL
jgi:hypothetical protein